MDPSFCGRQVFINAGRGKACSLAVAMQNMAATNYPGSREFACLAWENLRPERYRIHCVALVIIGVRTVVFIVLERGMLQSVCTLSELWGSK